MHRPNALAPRRHECRAPCSSATGLTLVIAPTIFLTAALSAAALAAEKAEPPAERRVGDLVVRPGPRVPTQGPIVSIANVRLYACHHRHRRIVRGEVEESWEPCVVMAGDLTSHAPGTRDAVVVTVRVYQAHPERVSQVCDVVVSLDGVRQDVPTPFVAASRHGVTEPHDLFWGITKVSVGKARKEG